MDWVPIFFFSFKIVVFGIGMFFAVKWHYDQEKDTDKGKVLRIAGKVGAIFALSLLVLLFVTFALARMLGLDLTLA